MAPVRKFNYVNSKKFLERIDELLPNYEKMFRLAEKNTGIDWRLLAAQAYQESHWDADASITNWCPWHHDADQCNGDETQY